ncbi:MAG: phospholipid carrier-dependent glycosyltransferase [Rubritepida sp.]|jgi:hypothetical protein|nr:phospholipid carrier-dependent glycosyltransferase [Rubritepida sp.]
MRRAFDALDRLPETRAAYLWLVLLCLVLFVPGLRGLPALDPAESRVAIATLRAMEAAAQVPSTEPGLHWAQAASVRTVEALGLHAQARARIWAYRIPSLLGAIAAVLATFHFGRALVGRRAAFLAAALLAASVGMAVAARIAVADAALLACTVAAMGLMGRAYLSPARVAPRQAAGVWLAAGGAVLLVGPGGALVPLLAAVTLAVADKGWATGLPWLRALRPGWGVPLMLLVAVPWLASAPAEGASAGWWVPPGAQLPGFILLGFPAAFLVLRALPGAWAERLHPPTRFLLAWAVPAWLAAEAGPGRSLLDALPAFPALMLLAAACVLDPLRRPPPRWLGVLAAGVLLAGAVGLGVAAALLPLLADGRVVVIALLALPLAVALAVLVLRLMRAGQPARAALLAVALTLPLHWIALGEVLPRLTAPWISPRLATLVLQAQPGIHDARLAVAGYEAPSLGFALGAGIARLGRGEDAASFLAAGPGRLVAVADRQEAAFRAEAAARGLGLREHGVVAGFDLARGRWVAISVFGVDG